MKIFLSNARKDDALARKLATRLERAGFSVWTADEQITPGENWAKKVAKGLEDSEMMVFLFTPRAMESDSLRRDTEFAIGSQQYANRVFSVLVGPTMHVGKHVPWILLTLPHRQVESAAGFSKVVRDIQQMSLANA